MINREIWQSLQDPSNLARRDMVAPPSMGKRLDQIFYKTENVSGQKFTLTLITPDGITACPTVQKETSVPYTWDGRTVLVYQFQNTETQKTLRCVTTQQDAQIMRSKLPNLEVHIITDIQRNGF